MSKEFLLLIDGSSLLSTQFFGNLPRQILFAKTPEEKEKYFDKILQTPDGFYTNAVYGFLKTLFKIIREQKPSHLAIAWDLTRDTFRRKLYPDYKANRGDTLAPLADQFAICEEALHHLGIKQFLSNDYEADDFIGSLAKRFEEELPVFIMTKDNDYLQLVNDKTKLWLMHSSPEKTDELYKKYSLDKAEVMAPDRCFVFDKELIKKEFGIEAENVNSLKGIMGDPSDNIKGVPGVGEATAVLLISHYKTVDNLYQAILHKDKKELETIKKFWKDELGIKRSPLNFLLKEADTELVGEKAARLSEELATIKRDIDFDGLSLEDLKLYLSKEGTSRIISALQFYSLRIDSLPASVFLGRRTVYAKYSLLEAKEKNLISERGRELMKSLSDKVGSSPSVLPETESFPEFSLIESSDIEELRAVLEGLSKVKNPIGFSITETSLEFVNEDKHYRFSYKNEEFSEFQEAFLQLIKTNKEAKFATFHLKEQLPLLAYSYQENILDLALLHYLLNPLSKEHGPIDCLHDFEGSILEEDSIYIARAAAILCDKLLERAKKHGMTELFFNIEMPLVYTLMEMEERGILVDKEILKEFGEELKRLMTGYEKEIHRMAGEEFNVNSPKQLGEILFEKLKLPRGKKTKTGYSTSADVLERLLLEDPIIEQILLYREVSKLKSTYTDGLYAYIKEDGRIHSKFQQLVTATGRLSSTEPNLQNIPIRTELGKKIRKAFIPKEGYVFVDADYSQIELRIMAHLSGDEELIMAYQGEKDIHRITAARVFSLPYSEVTDEERRKAKAVNFGILYGISSFGLGENLGIGRKEAEGYIKDYFAAYPAVKKYLDNLVLKAKEEGLVKTAFQRIRPIPELESNLFMQRQFGERIAMNSPVQGTSADIIKIAMNRVNERLKKEFPSSRLILQIHDELLIEAKEEEKEAVARIVKEEMEGAVSLKVPLEAEVKFGYNWYDSH